MTSAETVMHRDRAGMELHRLSDDVSAAWLGWQSGSAVIAAALNRRWRRAIAESGARAVRPFPQLRSARPPAAAATPVQRPTHGGSGSQARRCSTIVVRTISE